MAPMIDKASKNPTLFGSNWLFRNYWVTGGQ